MTPERSPELSEDALVAALDAAAAEVTVEVAVEAVLADVERRRAARRRGRQLGRLVAAAVVALVAGGVVALVVSDDGQRVRVADEDPPATTVPSETPLTEPGAVLDRVAVPGEGAEILGVGAGQDSFWVARGTTLTRFRPDGRVVASTRLEGRTRRAAPDGNRSVVIVEEPAVGGVAQWRLKRISPDGTVEQSVPVEVDGSPTFLEVLGDGSARVWTDRETVVVSADGLAGSREPLPDPSPGVFSRIRSGTTTWALDKQGITHEAADPRYRLFPGFRGAVAAPSWGEGHLAVETPPTTGGLVTVVDLAPTAPTSARAAVPSDASLVAVGADRVWLVEGTELVARATR